ncbi:MAG: EpsI family protein [Armatimonadetes bacterium]|nr:EpsI family protein [Armatimonadota bacterium]
MPRFQIYAGLLMLIMVAWAGLVGMVPPMAAGLRVEEDFKGIPMEVGDWSGLEDRFDLATYKILRTCSLLSREYVDDAGNRVNLSIVYGRDLGDFHQPEICMEGSGWKRTNSSSAWLNPVGGERHKASVVTMTNGYVDIVMVYWFYMAGQVSPSMGKEKVRALLEGLQGGQLQPSAMVKFTAPIIVDEETARKSAMRLSELLGQSIVDVASKPPKYVQSELVLEQFEGEE